MLKLLSKGVDKGAFKDATGTAHLNKPLLYPDKCTAS